MFTASTIISCLAILISVVNTVYMTLTVRRQNRQAKAKYHAPRNNYCYRLNDLDGDGDI